MQAAGRDYVLCWVQQALRAQDNAVIDVSVSVANHLGLPVLFYHGLGHRYPYASHRIHQFILEASRSLEEEAAKRGLTLRRFVETPEDERGLLYRLAERAAVVVTDDQPVFVSRWQADNLAKKSSRAVWAVDAACVVPMASFPTPLPTVWKFRKAVQPLLPRYVGGPPPSPLLPERGNYDGDLGFEPTSLDRFGPKRMAALCARCGVDMSLPPAPDFDGSRAEAEERLRWALREVLPSYNFRRNNAADPTAGSRLSPYLHFGVLGAREVARAVASADVHPAASRKFLDELINWREFFHHLARHSSDPDAYEGVPEAARETLAEHAGDPREKLYGLEALVHGETDDETWNASQKQYLYEGYMHNNLRMYWGKRLIAWHRTPRDAWQTACYLNDRLSLDGRDPATYGNLQWCFGRSKRAARETEVYGWVPRKSDRAMRRRPGMNEWLAREAARTDYRVDV